MKLTIVILLVSLLQVSTKVYSQGTKFNLNVKNKRIVEVLKEIEESSKFRFFYIREQVNVERVVSIKANQATIDDILEELFKRQGINFQVMEDFLILLSPEDITYINTNNLQQQKSISGTITDEFNQTLPGVTIYIKGTSQGTVSDSNGNYSISNILKNDILVFSFVGMSKQEIVVSGRTKIDIKMIFNAIGIEEVIALGYGVQRKIDVTGSVGMVDANVILERHSFNALQGIQGKIAGVNIFSNSGSPTGSTRVIIRGMNSIETTSDPLYVVDGVVDRKSVV